MCLWARYSFNQAKPIVTRILRERQLQSTASTRACSHYPQPISDEREVDKSDKHDVELFKSREDAPKALEPAEQPFDLVAPLVHGAVVLPRRDPVLLGWHHRDQAEVERQLPSLIAFVRPVHQQVHRPRRSAPPAQEFAPLGRIVGLAG